MSNDNEGEEVDKLLTLEEAVEGVRKIVEANPDFRYPMQGEVGIDGQEDRCLCVENDHLDDEDYYEMNYETSDCPWHFNDDNTCLYLRYNSTAPACVLGHYFVKELGFTDMHRFEAKSPQRVLDGHGYEVAPNAQRFLNTVQTLQDHGDSWGEALTGAMRESGYNV